MKRWLGIGFAAMAGLLPVPLAAQVPPGHRLEAKRPGTDAALRDELATMQEAHISARESKDRARIKETEAKNLKRLKAIVAKYGWPSETLVGEHAASSAWLIVHQSESDPDFQRKVLGLMEPLVRKGEANGQLYAYLYDRTHKPQRYGTQGSCTGPGQWQPRAMEDPDRVDERRRDLGLSPARLMEYAMMVGKNCK